MASDDAAALMTEIRELLDDRDDARGLGRPGCEFINGAFSWRRSSEELIAMLNSVEAKA